MNNKCIGFKELEKRFKEYLAEEMHQCENTIPSITSLLPEIAHDLGKIVHLWMFDTIEELYGEKENIK